MRHQVYCDYIFVGDPQLTRDAIETIINYEKEDAITLHLDTDIPELFENEWHNRPDVARDDSGVPVLLPAAWRQYYGEEKYCPGF